MKTKGEIEVIADKLYGEYAGYHKASFVNGYTQCQLDMVKDVEYWQSESDHWYQQAIDMANKKYTEEYIINIVNKSRSTGLTAEYLILQLNK